jgi:small multidrug resistance pump
VADCCGPDSDAPLQRYSPWLYAAAAYNVAWGTTTIFAPDLLFRLLGMPVPAPPPLCQVVGMFVLVYAPGYWWAARYPSRHPHLVLIGLLGKVLGPLGFAWTLAVGQLPLAFGLTILTNDLLWWPAFALYLRDAARIRGWTELLAGR